MSSTPSDGPSSTGWLGQRPSTDTPLHPSLDQSGIQNLHGKLNSMSIDTAAQQARFSGSSAGGDTATTISAGASARSSFALERASLEANRLSLEAFKAAPPMPTLAPGQPHQQAYAQLEEAADDHLTIDMLVALAGLPTELSEQYAALSVLPPRTPAPASVLALVWQINSPEQVMRTLEILAGHGIINIARLPTGHVWALPHDQQLHLLQMACKESMPKYHARLVDAYIAQAQTQQQKSIFSPVIPIDGDAAAPSVAKKHVALLTTLLDDGYFLANIGHHLVGAGRFDAAREMLFDPIWLERKLKACSAAAVVADFRRFLLAKPERSPKLVLEAFQMSVGLVQAHPNVPGLLRMMIIGRLMTVPLTEDMQTWLKGQRDAAEIDGACALAQGVVRPLPPQTPSLDQAGGLQRLALKGHRGAINKILLTPSQTEAVSAGADGTARVWDLEIGDCLLVIEGHTGGITDMAITADGSLLITASEDGTARASELEQGQCLRVLAGHEGPINALALDPFGRFIVTGGSDGTVRVWDLASARVLHVLNAPQGATTLALSPCTRYLLVGCVDFSVRVFDILSGQSMGTLLGHTRWISAVAFTQDGKRAVTAAHDGALRVWSLRSGRCSAVMEGHSGRINSMDVSLDGRLAATGGEDGIACVWDLKTGTCLKKLESHTSWITHVEFYSKGQRLLTTSGDGTAIAWSVDSGEVVKVLEGHSGAVLNAVVTRRGRFAVSASDDGSVRVWDFSASSTHTPKWHEGHIRALTAKDGLIVATAGDDCLARLWDSPLGEYRGLLKGHAIPIRWAQFSQDGTRLVTASPDRQVCVWDCATMELLHQLPVHKGSRMKSFAVSGDAATAVICLFDSTVTLWDLATGEPTMSLQKWGERDEALGHTSAVNEVLMTSDGGTVITLSKDYTARIWDAVTGTCLHVLRGHTDTVIGGCASEKGSTGTTECDGVVVTYSFDNTVRVWSLQGGPSLMTIPLESCVKKMTLTQGGDRFAAALSDGGIILCDLKQQRGVVDDHREESSEDHSEMLLQIQDERSPPLPALKSSVKLIRVEGHTDAITGLSFSSDGKVLSTCSMDGTARLIDASTGALIGVFVSDCGLTCCHYDSVNESIVAGTDRGVVHFIDAAEH
jgi:WD40 repeat protein